jgi:SAM-dependent methyltransferase
MTPLSRSACGLRARDHHENGATSMGSARRGGSGDSSAQACGPDHWLHRFVASNTSSTDMPMTIAGDGPPADLPSDVIVFAGPDLADKSVDRRSVTEDNPPMRTDHFGEDVAARYDGADGPFAAAVVERTADFLTDLARGRPALEFGIGTGRIALPLADRGVDVHGIDLSGAMLRRLRAKPGGGTITAVEGDFARDRVPGDFGLVYLVFNTIMNVTTQDDQVACFANAARHLADGGRFVVEVMVPDLQRLPPGETVRPFAVTAEHLGFDEYDVATQRMWSHHYRVGDAHMERSSVPFRYVWPAELDLMARPAGMEPVERWADWDRSPFTSESRSHVSVWERRSRDASPAAAAGAAPAGGSTDPNASAASAAPR